MKKLEMMRTSSVTSVTVHSILIKYHNECACLISVYMSVCLSVCLSVCPSCCLLVHPSKGKKVSLACATSSEWPNLIIPQWVSMSVFCLNVCLSVCLSVSLSVHKSVCQSIPTNCS